MGIVKVDDELHEEVRKASSVMVRSINAQAEYWMKIGMLAEANPTLSYHQIITEQMRQADVNVRTLIDGLSNLKTVRRVSNHARVWMLTGVCLCLLG